MPRAKKPAPRAKRAQSRRINKKAAFLAAFIISADLTAAAAACGMNRSQHYEWLRKDAKYRKAFEQADVQATQTVYDRAVNRALVGVYEPTIYQGRFSYPREAYEEYEAHPAIGKPGDEDYEPADIRTLLRPDAVPIGVYKQSEVLHLAILRAKIAAFRASSVEVAGKDGGPVQSEHRIVFVEPGQIPAGNTPPSSTPAKK